MILDCFGNQKCVKLVKKQRCVNFHAFSFTTCRVITIKKKRSLSQTLRGCKFEGGLNRQTLQKKKSILKMFGFNFEHTARTNNRCNVIG